MKQFLPRLSLVILIFSLIELLLFIMNYSLGTYLVGWDNIMPEFALNLNWQRSLISLWQEYRGLGTVDGLAHSANLLHTLYIKILATVLDESVVRYAFIHLTHLIGGIGFYFLITYILNRRSTLKKNYTPKNLDKISIAAFVGALFYMFNIGIIQMYFAPLEVFATHFAALPFLSLFILKSLHSPSRSNLFLLFLSSLAFSPQGFVPTVFIAFLILLLFFLIFHVLYPEDDYQEVYPSINERDGTSKNNKRLLNSSRIKVAVLTGLIVFLANAFWIVPYLYSAIVTPDVIANTRINEYASEEIFYRNKAHGDLISVAFLKGFMLSSIEYDHKQQKDVFFMKAWREHINTPWYTIFYIIFLLIAVIGILSLLRKRESYLLPFLASCGVALFFLANNTPLIDQMNTHLRNSFPLFGEAFRFPFTKFITLFAFNLSIFISLGVYNFLVAINKYTIFSFLFLLGGIGYLSFPAFQGNFTSSFLRLSIPTDYISLMKFLQKQDTDKRIALLPTHTFWNWHYRTWGHRGSGFLWYAIPQPILERAFDPWSQYNEQFYNEISHSLNNQNQILFASVLQKYDISYVLVDPYIVNTLSTQPINYNSLISFLEKSPSLSNKKVFGRLLLYEVNNSKRFITFISAKSVPNIVLGRERREDQLHASSNTYITDPKLPVDIYYIFPSFFTEKLQKDISFKVSETKEKIILSPKQPISIPPNGILKIPNLFASDFLIPISIEQHPQGIAVTPLYPQLIINGQYFPINVPSIIIPLSITNPTQVTMNAIGHTFSIRGENNRTLLLKDEENPIKVSNGKDEETVIIDTQQMNKDPLIFPLPNVTIQKLEVEIPKISGPLSFNDILENRDYTIIKNNEKVHPFAGEKDYARTIQLGHEVTLQAKSASEQLVFYKNNLFHNGSYILLTTIDYKEGLPMSFYLDNTFEKRAELEALFDKKDTTNVLIIPRTQEFFQGYGFHFTVKSVGTERVESTIKTLSLYPFPQIMLEMMSLVSRNNQSRMKTTPAPLLYTKDNVYTYRLTASLPEESYVILSQAYSPYWIAYRFTTSLSPLQKIFPFLGGTRLNNHVLINNWKNGWRVPKGVSYIVILFAPGYLQTTGQLITLISGAVLIFLTFNKKNDL